MSSDKNHNPEESSKDPSVIVLDYGDYIIRQSDVDLLTDNQWLNDLLIGFYFNYLSDQFAVMKDCMYIGPEVAQLIKMVPASQVDMIISDLKNDLKSKKFVFVAVNDSDNPNAHSSGSHWSLLVYSRKDKECVHIDSSSNHNSDDATSLHAKLRKYLDSNRLSNLVGCNQQANGRDCGLHVICNALRISQAVNKDTTIKSFVTADAKEADAMRKDLVILIHNLAKNKLK